MWIKTGTLKGGDATDGNIQGFIDNSINPGVLLNSEPHGGLDIPMR